MIDPLETAFRYAADRLREHPMLTDGDGDDDITVALVYTHGDRHGYVRIGIPPAALKDCALGDLERRFFTPMVSYVREKLTR